MPGALIKGYYVTDFYHFHWNYWWIRHALTTPGLNVYETDFVMFPAKSNLGFHTMAPFYFPLWAILEPIIGTVEAFNIIIIFGLALTGISFFALARYFNINRGLALVGGLVLQLTPGSWNAIYMSTLHYISVFWLPLHILIWAYVIKHIAHYKKGILWSVVMGFAFWGTLMTDPQTLIYSAFLIVPFGLVRFIELKRWITRLLYCLYGLIALVVTFILSWFAGSLSYMLSFDRDVLAPGDYEGAYAISFPDGFFSRLPDYWLTNERISLGAIIVPLFMITIIFALLSYRHLEKKRILFWLVLGTVPLLLSAGGTIVLNNTEIAMPYRIVHDMFGGMFRQPARFANAFLVAGFIFIGLVWTQTIQNKTVKQWCVLGLLLLVFYDTRIFESIPTQEPPRAYSFYNKIGDETGNPYDDYVVLDVPTAGASGETSLGPPQALTTQFYALYHEKRTVNGLLARVDNWKFLYMETADPMLSWLGQRRYLNPELVEAQLQERIYDWPIGYIVIHKDYIGQTEPANQEIIGYFNQLDDLVCPYTIESKAVVYRTTWHPDGCPVRTPPEISNGVYRIDIGAEGDEKFIGWGFHWQEPLFDTMMRWTGAEPLINGNPNYSQVNLYVDLPLADYQLAFEAQAFAEDRQVELFVNNTSIGQAVILAESLQTYEFMIPTEVLRDGHHIELSLHYDDAIVPADAGINSDPRRLAFMWTWAEFRQISDS